MDVKHQVNSELNQTILHLILHCFISLMYPYWHRSFPWP